MPSRLDYQELLAEISQAIAEPDWPSVRRWLEQQENDARRRDDRLTPDSVATLERATFPALQSGDVLTAPALAVAPLTIPAQTRLSAPLLAAQSVTLSADVVADEDVIAHEMISWERGPNSRVRNLLAPRLQITGKGGTVQGGLWADALVGDAQNPHLPAETTVNGVVVVTQPGEEPVLVGRGSVIGALLVKGSARTEHEVAISHVSTQDTLEIGRSNRIGYASATTVRVAQESRISVLVCQGDCTLEEGVVVDNLRAVGDIVCTGPVTITGDTVISEQGSFQSPVGAGWFSQPQHWFYTLPDDRLRPWQADAPRPADSTLVALRGLTHELWHTIERAAGEGESDE